ncbi:NUDIX hydrolase [bacterium]|nr:NUDIX hydrolase [bacterium]MBU1985161.1 NUDIX hydrolase [bacterium]
MSECDGRPRPVCTQCGHVVYLNPIPSVAVILEREGRLLLVKRNIEPGIGQWSLPGGFIEAGETAVEAVVREIHEETGLNCRPERVVDVATYLGGYYGDVLVVCYQVQSVSGDLIPGGDADEVDFFDPLRLPPIAFDIHRQFIIRHAGRTVETLHS